MPRSIVRIRMPRSIVRIRIPRIIVRHFLNEQQRAVQLCPRAVLRARDQPQRVNARLVQRLYRRVQHQQLRKRQIHIIAVHLLRAIAIVLVLAKPAVDLVCNLRKPAAGARDVSLHRQDFVQRNDHLVQRKFADDLRRRHCRQRAQRHQNHQKYRKSPFQILHHARSPSGFVLLLQL